MKEQKMQSPQVRKSFVKQNFTFVVLLPAIVGVHIGWFIYQQRYIPEEERHDHPLTKLYKKYIA